MSSYIHMFGQLVSNRPAKAGVWKRKEGGYFVRARVKVRGKLNEIRKVLEDCTGAADAYAWLQEQVREAPTRPRPPNRSDSASANMLSRF